MSDHFGIENHMVIGNADTYEESIGDRKPKLSFYWSRHGALPMAANISADNIEGERVKQIRNEALLFDALRVTQRQAEGLFRNEMRRNAIASEARKQ